MTFVRSKRVDIIFHSKYRRNFNYATAFLLASALLLASHLAQAGNLDKIIAFDIAPTTLDKALLAFGAREHLQIMFEWNSSTIMLPTRQLKGRYTGKQALAEFLHGTRLTYIERGHTLEILPRASSESSSTARARKPSGAQSGRDPQGSNHSASGVPDPPAATGHPENGKQPQTLSEIIVTAQKYSQRAFDVPISLDVISGQQLQQYSITNLSDLQYDVPGLYMNSTGVGHAVYLRGVGNSRGNGAMVGQYIDDADITAEGTSGETGTATGDNGLYDLNRVEVLKGPQGTLYGDGSTGGVIRYITNKPVLDDFQMSADVAELFTQYGAPSQRTDAMLNTPLMQGTLGLRFAGMFEHDGGWVNEPAANLKNINDSNLVDVRAEALWEPTTRVKVNVTQIVHRHALGLAMGEDVSGNITPLFETTLTPHQTENSDISNATVTYDLGNVQLLSSATYYSETQDIHDLFSSLSAGPLTFGELIPSYNYYNADYSEEVRLDNSGGGAWHWTIGSFYKHFRDQLFYPKIYFGLAGSPLTSASKFPGAAERNVSSSWAGFMDTSYELFKGFTFGAGARYYEDHEITSFLPTAKFTSVDPRFYVQYKVTEHVNTYVSASKGFRSGGANVPPAPPFQPENLWSYDLGTKIQVPDQGLTADVDIFDMEYSNYVTIVYIPPIYETANAGNARIRGVDADLTWHSVDGWRIGVNTELLNTKFLTASAISGYAAGDRLPYAPTYSFTASVGHGFHWKHRHGVLEVYAYEISRVQDRQAGAPLAQSDVRRFLNFRASLNWNDDLTFELFAQNLLNDRGIESPDYLFSGEPVRPRPRTLGIEFDVSFGQR